MVLIIVLVRSRYINLAPHIAVGPQDIRDLSSGRSIRCVGHVNLYFVEAGGVKISPQSRHHCETDFLRLLHFVLNPHYIGKSAGLCFLHARISYHRLRPFFRIGYVFVHLPFGVHTSILHVAHEGKAHIS